MTFNSVAGLFFNIYLIRHVKDLINTLNLKKDVKPVIAIETLFQSG